MITPDDESGSLRSASQRTLMLRILSALFLIPIVLFIAHQGGIVFFVAIGVAAILMAVEWSAPVYGSLRTPSFAIQILTALVACMLAASQSMIFVVMGLGVIVAGTALGVLADLSQRRSPFWPLLGIPYVAFFCFACIWLRNDPVFGRDLIFWLLAVVWATDTAAFAAGSTLGGPKLWPSVSPNKTWSGLLGGVLAGGWLGAVAAAVLLEGVVSFLPLVLLGMALGAVAQAGDLAESAFKRHFGLKDSGRLIPGHGGLLDRIDGLVFAVLAAAMIALVRGHAGSQAGAVLLW